MTTSRSIHKVLDSVDSGTCVRCAVTAAMAPDAAMLRST